MFRGLVWGGGWSQEIIKKGQTVLTEELDNKIIALYGLGMGYRDISKHMEEIYGTQISKSSITAIIPFPTSNCP